MKIIESSCWWKYYIGDCIEWADEGNPKLINKRVGIDENFIRKKETYMLVYGFERAF